MAGAGVRKTRVDALVPDAANLCALPDNSAAAAAPPAANLVAAASALPPPAAGPAGDAAARKASRLTPGWC